MAKQLNLMAPWPGPRAILQPGSYAIPGQISRTYARCAVADGAGEIVETEPFRVSGDAEKPVDAPAKRAPVNKARGAAPENKSPVGNRHRRGNRS